MILICFLEIKKIKIFCEGVNALPFVSFKFRKGWRWGHSGMRMLENNGFLYILLQLMLMFYVLNLSIRRGGSGGGDRKDLVILPLRGGGGVKDWLRNLNQFKKETAS